VTEAEAIARRAAERLGAEMDPALPGGVARVLTRSRRSPDGDLPDGADLATFVVAAAAFGCRLSAGTSGTAEPTRATLERRLRRQFGIDEDMSPDHETIIDAVAEAICARDDGADVRR
jgi:hypothetical protein